MNKERKDHYQSVQDKLLDEISTKGTFSSKPLENKDFVIRVIGVYCIQRSVNTQDDYEKAIKSILPLLKDEDTMVRRRAYEAVLGLGFRYKPESKDLFDIALDGSIDADFKVREQVFQMISGKVFFESSNMPKRYLNLIDQGLIHSDEKTRILATEALGHFIKNVDNPTQKIKEVLKDESENVRRTAASLLAITLPRLQSPEKVFEDFQDYPVTEFPEIHGALVGMGLFFEKFARENEKYKSYLSDVVSKTDDWYVSHQTFFMVGKRLGILDPHLARILSSALENDNPEIRAQARYFYIQVEERYNFLKTNNLI